MIKNDKPAARDAAGSAGDAFSWQATHPEYEPFRPCDQARLGAPRTLADIVSTGPSEAPCRESHGRLRAAMACIFDALAIERRAMGGRIAP